jgi:hypothetical protein
VTFCGLLLAGSLAAITQSGLVVTSASNPAISLRVADGYVPQPPVALSLESTDVDRRVFVQADGANHIQRLIIVQFEHVRSGETFRFVYAPKPAFTFGTEVYRVGTYVYDDSAESKAFPTREAGVTRAALMKSGYVVPRLFRTARLARVSDSNGTSEIILFYIENADAEYPSGVLPGADQDGDLVLTGQDANALLQRMSTVLYTFKGGGAGDGDSPRAGLVKVAQSSASSSASSPQNSSPSTTQLGAPNMPRSIAISVFRRRLPRNSGEVAFSGKPSGAPTSSSKAASIEGSPMSRSSPKLPTNTRLMKSPHQVWESAAQAMRAANTEFLGNTDGLRQGRFPFFASRSISRHM